MSITAEHIRRAEQVLRDNGIAEDEVKTVLQAIGYTLCDTELYPADGADLPASAEQEYFGIVRWCREDIVGKMKEKHIETTEERVAQVINQLSHHSFTDMMIETGWDVIEQVIDEQGW